MYSSVADVRNALLPGADNDGITPSTDKTTAASLDDLQITAAINEADATINTYLSVPSSRTVPLDQADHSVAAAPVRYWSRNIAAYLATLTFRRGKDLAQDDPVRLRYTDTIAMLVMIRDGKVENPLPGPVQPGDGGDNEPLILNQYNGTGPGLFSPSDFFGYPNRLGNRMPIKTWPGY